MKNNLLKCTLFFVVVLLVFFPIHVFLSVTTAPYERASIFSRKQSEVTDVVIFGSSHVHSGIHPAVLWAQSGISAFDHACDGVPLWSTYFDLLDLLNSNKEKPKLILLDVYSVFMHNPPQVYYFFRSNNYLPSFSFAQINRLRTHLPETWIDYLLQYPIYHNKYSENLIDPLQAVKFKASLVRSKGAMFPHYIYEAYYDTITPKSMLPDVSNITDAQPLVSDDAFYLQEFINLTKEHDIPLLLIKIPYLGFSADHKALYNTVETVAAENGVGFIDFNENEYMPSIGLDPSIDFREDSHLNYTGMEKFSLYLADYLKQNYSLPDHRGDPRYKTYDESLAIWNSFLSQQDLLLQQSPTLYMQQLPEFLNDNTVIISKAGNQIQSLEASTLLKNTLVQFGVSTEQYDRGGTWIIKNGRIVFDSKGQPDFSYRLLLGTNGANLTNSTSIQYQTDSLEGASDGLMVFIYNNEYDEVLDAVKIDAYWPDYVHHFYPTMQPLPTEPAA